MHPTGEQIHSRGSGLRLHTNREAQLSTYPLLLPGCISNETRPLKLLRCVFQTLRDRNQVSWIKRKPFPSKLLLSGYLITSTGKVTKDTISWYWLQSCDSPATASEVLGLQHAPPGLTSSLNRQCILCPSEAATADAVTVASVPYCRVPVRVPAYITQFVKQFLTFA